jgi:competence protein ComEC
MHLLAISGLHIGIIAGIFLILGIFIFGKQRSFYIWFALLAVWLYVVLAGMRPPVVRGAIMGSLFLLAEYLGRQRSAMTALGFTAAAMVAIHPRILWEVSFQLSFLAMAGIIYFFPHFRSPKGRRVVSTVGGGGRLAGVRDMVGDSFAMSLSAVIAVWPVIAYNFGVISLVGLPATFLSLLAVPCIIAAAALVAFSGLFLPLLSQVLGWAAWFFLSYLMLVSQCFDALPLSSLQVGSFSARLVWGYYVVLVVVVGYLELKGRKEWSLVNLRSQEER